MAREKNKSSPMKLALNDDRGEKAARLQSRQALQEIHMNEIRAAASPVRKLNPRRDTNSRAMSESPRTPRTSDANLRKKIAAQRRQSQIQNANNNSPGGSTVTPMKRVPILANFEEWMKMATDNKINAANSWNFALIDYFHDMSLLKEGDGVNFQKASCTLDGCVKIYTSRVDSVATETGRLLSGLADGAEGNKKKAKDGEDEEDEDGEEGEDGEDGEGKKKKKKPARSHEATLAPGFASFQGKKLELEFAVDPLFKKASADFDEGGAKGLLLNHLSIDSDGRIVFDSSDDAGDAALAAEKSHQEGDDTELQRTTAEAEEQQEEQEAAEAEQEQDEEIDLGALAAKFFPDMSMLDNQDICPSMKSFTLGDPSGDLNIPFLKAPDDWREQKKGAATPQPPSADANLNLSDQTGIFLDGSNAMGFDDDDDDGGLLGGFDVADNVGFGEGGEAWAKDAAIEAQTRVARAEDVDDNLIEGNNADGYALSLQHKYQEDAEHESIMAYFDKAFNSRAKGKTAFMTLENWRMQKIQRAQQAETSAPTRQKKEKEPFEIDFLGPMSESLQDLLEAPAVLNSQISLPKAQWKTKGRNLLDKDDEVVDPRKLMRLWTKPKCRVGRRKGKLGVIDEGFGARNRIGTADAPTEDEEDEGRKGDYDADFFADDDQMPFFDGQLPIDDDDDDGFADGGGDEGQAFMDAREMLSPQPEGQPADLLGPMIDGPEDGVDGASQEQPLQPEVKNEMELLPGSFGSQLVTQAGRRLRPEYVNYARTAKKVDVRRLKENLWKGMSGRLERIAVFERPPSSAPPAPVTEGEDVDMMDVDGRQGGEQQEQTQQQLAEQDGAGTGTEVLKFTDLIQDLRTVYPEQQMRDISTSYCFICLLHLANEKGLVLEGDCDGSGQGEMQEILVSKDKSVGDGYEGE
ncbi:condensin complex subunit 2 [Exophiala viscosa]|uniref:Condensin complex subunit 2 n=1 Tax=Exophiala viscosa TaxID=2486360 RepID=A0AAN6DT25_9EURO|nr:condensin complex subunit 2 [Exophiala viscosa]